jgi:protein tyrosine phosphatase (PTP) superfamily phosphohydrolase (DUF442 family)
MMDTFQRIDKDCALTKQLTPEQIQQLPHHGFKSVLNLRSLHEPGICGDEQQQIEALGLQYFNVPILLEPINETLAEMLLSVIQSLPKPMLIYCASAHSISVVALLEIAQEKELTPERASELGLTLGFDFAKHPNLKFFIYDEFRECQFHAETLKQRLKTVGKQQTIQLQ